MLIFHTKACRQDAGAPRNLTFLLKPRAPISSMEMTKLVDLWG